MQVLSRFMHAVSDTSLTLGFAGQAVTTCDIPMSFLSSLEGT